MLLTGATGGLGTALASLLTARGAELVLSGRDPGRLEALARQASASTYLADLTDRDELDGLVQKAAPLDILIVNAGVGGDVPLPEVTIEDIDRMVGINLYAAMRLSVAFAQHHLQRGQPGHIVLIGSLAGLVTGANSRLYNATKFGLRGFGLGLRSDLAGSGVSVSVVQPGFISGAGMFAASGVALPRFVRTCSPEQVARTVLRAIETDAGEVFAAPPELVLYAKLATAVPRVNAWLQRRTGVAQRTQARRR